MAGAIVQGMHRRVARSHTAASQRDILGLADDKRKRERTEDKRGCAEDRMRERGEDKRKRERAEDSETAADFEIVEEDKRERADETTVADFEIVEEHAFVTDEGMDWRAWRNAGRAALVENNTAILDELGFQGFHRNLLAYIKHAIMAHVPAHLREIIHTNINWPDLHRDYIAVDPETRAQRNLMWLDHNGKLAVFEFTWHPRPEK